MEQTQNRISDARLAELICVAEDDPGDDDIGADMVNVLRGYAALRASHKRLVEALEGVQPYMEAAETAGLVGDEGCHWPVENVRATLADARKLEGK